MEYKIAIEETLRRVVDVEAESPALAVCRTEDEYNREEHVLTANDFIGVNITLASEDKKAQEYLNNSTFLSFVERHFSDSSADIPLEDKARLAFGSLDNAIHDFDRQGNSPPAEEKEIWLLYRCDAWLSTASMELVAPFSSKEAVTDYLAGNRKRFRLTQWALDFFRENNQTQRGSSNYIVFSHSLDPASEPQPADTDDAFYNETPDMEAIRLEEMDEAAAYFKVPYYEDLQE